MLFGLTPPSRERRSPHKPPRPASSSRAHRFITRDGRINVKRNGLNYHRPRDLYHWLLSTTWPKLIATLAGIYLFINACFGLLYVLDPGGIKGARPGSFADAFFFSVHVLSTLGFSDMSPDGMYVNLVVTLESLAALSCFGLISGLIFSRALLKTPLAQVKQF